MADRPTNWAGNVAFQAKERYSPVSVAQVQAVVAGNDRVRAVGTGHSFNELADTSGTHIALDRLPPVVEVDSASASVRVAAGLPYSDVVRAVDAQGFALNNLASLPHISVGGSCATGTHGSGTANRCLAAAVRGLEIVTAEGDVAVLDRDKHGERFNGAVVALGRLGVVTHLTLDLVPSFDMRQRIYEGLPFDVLTEHFADIVTAAYSVCVFLDWDNASPAQVWINQLVQDPEPSIVNAPWFSAEPATEPRHPISHLSADCCTEQLGVVGRWFERLPHFRPEFTPSAGNELQSEYLLPFDEAVPALRALHRIRGRIRPVRQICEIRTIAPDDLWLSASYRRATVSIHFTWIADASAVLPVVSLVEEALAPFSAVPHWGKVFTTPPDIVREHYERLPDFRDLMSEYDPDGKFANSFTERYLEEI